MLKKLDHILNITMGSFIGVFAGRAAYGLWHYKAYPDFYAMWSAPWYTGIFVQGILTVAVLAVSIIIKLVIRRKSGGNE